MPKNRRRNLAAVLAADARAKAERAFVAAAPAQRRRQPDVQLGVRVPRDLAERLRATVQLRHAAGQHPFTAGAVVAAALHAWLDEHAATDGERPTARAMAKQLRLLADKLEQTR
jgi:hypothetical protein